MILKNFKVGFDLDGTIYDFYNSYLKRFSKPKYDWVISRNVNNILINEQEFWENLPVIRRPNFNPELYCSARVSSIEWTINALTKNNLPEAPLIQVPGYKLSKVPYLKGKVSVFIEDSLKNFIDLNSNGVPCLLIDSPENQSWGPVLRIYTLDYEEILDAYCLGVISDMFNNFKELL